MFAGKKNIIKSFLLVLLPLVLIPFSGKWFQCNVMKILFIILSNFFLGAGIVWLCYHFSFRLLPNLAIAGAWTILLIIAETTICNACMMTSKTEVLTFVTLLKDAYYNSNLGSDFIKTFLEIYSIGIFGTVFLSLITEASRSLWEDEVRSTENKTLLAKFKRVRRECVLSRKSPFDRKDENLVSVVYIHMMLYLIVLLPVIVIVAALTASNTTIIRIDVILLLMSVSMEAIGVASHFIITDRALTSSEIKFLQQKKTYIEGKLTKALIKRDDSEQSNAPTCEGIVATKEANNYFQVIVHAYCNHSDIESPNRSVFFPELSAKGDQPAGCRLYIVNNIIHRFDKTNAIYIKPNEERYYASASSMFEPAFAVDVNDYLFSQYNNTTGSARRFPETVLEAIAVARHCFFTAQREAWEKWLYAGNISYEKMISVLMLDYLRRQFPDKNKTLCPCNGDHCKVGHKAEFGALILEFPYAIEKCIQDRYDGWFHGGKPSEPQERMMGLPGYRERVEQYYWQLFRTEINQMDRDVCMQIGGRFAAFLQDSYRKEEKYLHRILPVNRNNYTMTDDKPDASIKFSKKRLAETAYDIATKRYEVVVPGWAELFNIEHVNSVAETVTMNNDLPENFWKQFSEELFSTNYPYKLSRLTCYDVEKGNEASYESERCDGCCIDRKEQCVVLSYAMFKKLE